MFKSGDKVKCVSKHHTGDRNGTLIEIDQIYTVGRLHHGRGTRYGVLQEYHQISLVETDTDCCISWFMVDDFVPWQDTDDAWDRAMGIL